MANQLLAKFRGGSWLPSVWRVPEIRIRASTLAGENEAGGSPAGSAGPHISPGRGRIFSFLLPLLPDPAQFPLYNHCHPNGAGGGGLLSHGDMFFFVLSWKWFHRCVYFL